MTRQRYTFRESLNRILRILENKAPSTDTPNALTGEVLSADEAASDLAELLAGSLPSETFSFALPSTVDLAAFNASIVETDIGAEASKFITPYDLYSVQRFSEIYTTTGTVTVSMTGSQWNKITGSFQNSADLSSGFNDEEPANDRILVKNHWSSYFVLYNVSYIGSPDTVYTFAAGTTGSAYNQTRSVSKPITSGSYAQASGFGYVYISGTSVAMEVLVNPSQTAFFKLLSGQFLVQRVNSY